MYRPDINSKGGYKTTIRFHRKINKNLYGPVEHELQFYSEEFFRKYAIEMKRLERIEKLKRLDEKSN